MLSDALCPSVAILRRSLDPDDPMPEQQRLAIESHVDQCDRGCKEAIEAVLRGATLPLTPGGTEADTRSGPGGPAAATVSELPAPPPAPPGYEILGELGRGGMGVVYKARQTTLNRVVALKMILAGSHAGADDLARFRTEAEAVAALQHPNIVQIHEVGQHEGRPFIALEFVEGGTLAERLAGAPQPPEQAAWTVETLARAIHFAHQQGVLHRDLKPANLLLTADGDPKISDFGLAKRLHADAGHTRTGEIVGTPSYMAPEQAAPGSAPIGTPADVYALGAILYEMLTGRPPFQAKTAWEVLTLVSSAEPSPPRRLRPATPADLETICLKCLLKEPRGRYGSAEALADDLRRFLTDRPIQARRVGAAERAVKWARRNRLAAALAAVAILAAAGGGGVWLWAALDREAADRLTAARRARAEQAAAVALDEARDDEDRAEAVEQAADEKGTEEPETPETANHALQLRRQAEAALDEAERMLADVPGTEAARTRTAERRREGEAKLGQVEKVAALLGDLEKARAAQAAVRAEALDVNASARFYEAAMRDYGLDLTRPEAETTVELRQARPGVRLALLLALDDWANCIRYRDAAQAVRLGRIAAQADDDDWRRRYRAAAGDVDALKRLAEEAAGRYLPIVSVILLERDLRERGARSEATALLRAARRQHATDFWVYYDLTSCLAPDRIHIDAAALEDAESNACAAVALRPDSATAQVSLGFVLELRGAPAAAADCYRKAIKLDPNYAQPHDNLGNVLHDQGDLAGAVECFKKAIALSPTLASAHNDLGAVLTDQGDLAGAAQSFKKATEIDPSNAVIHSNLAAALRDQGDLAGAVQSFKMAVELDPTDAISLNGLGAVLYGQGDQDAAAEYYKKAIENDPKYAFPQYNLGNVLYDKGDRDGAAERFRKAIELDPHYAPAHDKLGEVLRDQGDSAAAVECFKKAIENDPKLADPHNDLGKMLLDQGNLAEAAECFEKAIQCNPKFALPHYNLGIVRFNWDDRKGAADYFRKAIELDPKLVEAHYNLGMVLLYQGKFAEARASFVRCQKLLPLTSPLLSGTLNKLMQCDHLLALEVKLPSVLKGEQQPADDAERIGLATVCQGQGRYVAAARFCRTAFDDDPTLADDLQAGDRYDAACFAARAGCGQGEDARALDERERAGWRKQALDWLRADLVLWQKRLDGGKAEDRQATEEQMARWQKDPALAGLRDAAELAKLPTDEREAWGKLWADVESLLKKVQEK